MILFTGRGALYNAFSGKYACRVISLRTISDEELIKEIRAAKVIVHNAALLHPQNYMESVTANFLLTRRIIDLAYAHAAGVKFINISSMSILENSSNYKPLELMDDYAFSKYLAEAYCLKHPLTRMISLRFSTVFYANPLKDGLSALVYQAVKKGEITLLNNGEAKRDFIPLEIAVDYLYRICKNEEQQRGVLTIASGKPFNFKEIAQLLVELLPGLNVKNNTNAETQKVLHTFDLNDAEKTGMIAFTLSDHIKKYVNTLKNDLADIQ